MVFLMLIPWNLLRFALWSSMWLIFKVLCVYLKKNVILLLSSTVFLHVCSIKWFCIFQSYIFLLIFFVILLDF